MPLYLFRFRGVFVLKDGLIFRNECETKETSIVVLVLIIVMRGMYYVRCEVRKYTYLGVTICVPQ